MLIKTKGIALKSIKYGETSLISTFYTASNGLLTFIVNGVRSSKAKNKAALFQPGSLLDLVVYYKPNQQLMRLKEFQHAHIYTSLPFDIGKSAIAQFLIEVIEQCIKEEEPNEALFHFISNNFKTLDVSKSANNDFHLQFLVALMNYIGIQPQNNYDSTTKYFSKVEGSFLETENPALATSSLVLSKKWHELLLFQDKFNHDRNNRRLMLNELLAYYEIHIHGFRKIKSLKILEMVFS